MTLAFFNGQSWHRLKANAVTIILTPTRLTVVAVATPEEVDLALSQAVESGGSILKPTRKAEWGGYSGYFADPDGHPWEIAWAPQFQLKEGNLVLPD